MVKRITFKNSRHKTIVCNLYEASSNTIVIMAPGSCSDKSSQGRFDIFARSLNAQGIAALTIDFSGCGESDDDSICVEKEVDDLITAVSAIKSMNYQKIGLLGNSLGALVCFKAYSPDIKTIVATGGLTGPMQYDWPNYFKPEQMIELKEKGYISTFDAHNMHRLKVVIDKKLLTEIESIKQQDIYPPIQCPVLFIHGDGDPEEQALHEHSQSALSFLSSTSEIKIIKGAGHGFWGFIGEVDQILTEWFAKNLQPGSA